MSVSRNRKERNQPQQLQQEPLNPFSILSALQQSLSNGGINSSNNQNGWFNNPPNIERQNTNSQHQHRRQDPIPQR